MRIALMRQQNPIINVFNDEQTCENVKIENKSFHRYLSDVPSSNVSLHPVSFQLKQENWFERIINVIFALTYKSLLPSITSFVFDTLHKLSCFNFLFKFYQNKSKDLFHIVDTIYLRYFFKVQLGKSFFSVENIISTFKAKPKL